MTLTSTQAGISISEDLSMIWHGTDGTDGFEAGIHLRWQFFKKFCFPRENSNKSGIEIDPSRRLPKTLPDSLFNMAGP